MIYVRRIPISVRAFYFLTSELVPDFVLTVIIAIIIIAYNITLIFLYHYYVIIIIIQMLQIALPCTVYACVRVPSVRSVIGPWTTEVPRK
jgi:hypothetical protein